MSVAAASVDARLNERLIAARIERLPFPSWQLIIGIIIASAWFFDAVDALAIAYVLPVLNGLWKLTPGETGILIACGYAGQTIGSIAAGWVAERWARGPGPVSPDHSTHLQPHEPRLRGGVELPIDVLVPRDPGYRPRWRSADHD